VKVQPRAVTCYVLLYETKKSRAKSAGTTRHLVGAARVRVDNEADTCDVTYLAVSGLTHLVGRKDTYPRSEVYITAEERQEFHDLVVRYWRDPWRGQAGR